MRYSDPVRWWWSCVAVVVGPGLLAAACLDNPSINGSNVAPINDPNPSCADYPDGAPGICTRIQDLCGYAPLGNDGGCTNPQATGYCDMYLTGALQCIAVASSCQQVWDTTPPASDAAFGGCAYVPPTTDASTDDGSIDAVSE